jgi:hypothetical protein
MEWPKKKVWKTLKKGKDDFNNKHGFQVFIWALQVGMRLVNAWQTPFFLAYKSLGMCT